MFRHQGPARSDQLNALLAAYLACVGGFVNSSGFVLLGTFTSHVTGNTGHFADDLISRKFAPAAIALGMIVAFYLGAFVASMLLESRLFSRTPTAYGVVLSSEAVLLSMFTLAATHRTRIAPHDVRAVQALWLCAAMGVQNSLVTRLSGAVVRTTHLTGVVTDLGIESARLLAAWYRHPTQALRAERRQQRARPILGKLKLHATIFATFMVGSVLGAALTVTWTQRALIVPIALVALGAWYAFASAKQAPLRTSRAPAEQPDTAARDTAREPEALGHSAPPP